MKATLSTIGRTHSENLRLMALPLAILVAGIHLMHPQLGLPRLLLYFEVGTVFDPRPVLFTVSGVLIVIGIGLAATGRYERPVYAIGAVLMGCYLLGYGAWHTVLEHGAFWPHIEAHGHTDMGPATVVINHLRGDVVALVSKVAELVLAILLILLYSGSE